MCRCTDRTWGLVQCFSLLVFVVSTHTPPDWFWLNIVSSWLINVIKRFFVCDDSLVCSRHCGFLMHSVTPFSPWPPGTAQSVFLDPLIYKLSTNSSDWEQVGIKQNRCGSRTEWWMMPTRDLVIKKKKKNVVVCYSTENKTGLAAA